MQNSLCSKKAQKSKKKYWYGKKIEFYKIIKYEMMRILNKVSQEGF